MLSIYATRLLWFLSLHFTLHGVFCAPVAGPSSPDKLSSVNGLQRVLADGIGAGFGGGYGLSFSGHFGDLNWGVSGAVGGGFGGGVGTGDVNCGGGGSGGGNTEDGSSNEQIAQPYRFMANQRPMAKREETSSPFEVQFKPSAEPILRLFGYNLYIWYGGPASGLQKRELSHNAGGGGGGNGGCSPNPPLPLSPTLTTVTATESTTATVTLPPSTTIGGPHRHWPFTNSSQVATYTTSIWDGNTTYTSVVTTTTAAPSLPWSSWSEGPGNGYPTASPITSTSSRSPERSNTTQELSTLSISSTRTSTVSNTWRNTWWTPPTVITKTVTYTEPAETTTIFETPGMR